MSLLFRSRSKPEVRGVRIPPQYLSYSGGGSGVYVDGDSALRHDAVWACVMAIAQDVSLMPVDTYRVQGGRKVPVDPAPQIVTAPSVSVDDLDWRYQVLVGWLSAGNSWGSITQVDSVSGKPTRIELLPDSAVRRQNTNGRLQFFVDNTERFLWPVGDLWHKPAYTIPGSPLGLSPIAYHAMTIGMGLTAQKFGHDYLADGGHPSSIWQPEGDIGETAAKTLKEKIMQLTRGNREPIVIPASMKYTPIQINPDESQFLDTMKYSSEQIIGRIYREDPADYGLSSGSGGSITYTNRVDVDLARFKKRQFWVTKLQKALGDLCPEGQFVKLNTSVSLMMTAKERHELHALRLKSETTTVNEVRDIEDEKPFTDPKFNEPGIPDLLKADPAKGATT